MKLHQTEMQSQNEGAPERNGNNDHAVETKICKNNKDSVSKQSLTLQIMYSVVHVSSSKSACNKTFSRCVRSATEMDIEPAILVSSLTKK